MPPSPSSPWEALRAGFRRACVRRLVGDEVGAIAVLRDEIPGLVVGWAKTSSLEAPEKKAKLKEVFDDESGRADELAVAFDLFAARFETKVADHVSQEVKQARSELLAVSIKIEEALSSFSKRIDELSSVNEPSPALSSFAPHSIEEGATMQEIEVPVPQNLVAEEEPVQKATSSEITSEPQIKSAEIDSEDVSNLEPEAELPLTLKPEPKPKSRSRSKSEIEPGSETETLAETPAVTPRGIRFDDIEGMIDELLSEEK